MANAAPSLDEGDRAFERGFVTEAVSTALGRDGHTPALIALLSNKLVWSQSKVFRRLFGLGINDWRIINTLAKFPGSTASELCEILVMSKSIASRSVNVLASKGLIGHIEGERVARHLFLTQDGVVVHDQMANEALKMRAIVHQDLTDEEVEIVNDLLTRMLSSVESSLQDYESDREQGGQATPA